MFHLAPLRARLVGAFVLTVLGAGSASAATFSQGLSFSTGTQSVWGPGAGSASFGTSGSAGIPRVAGPFDVQITPGLGVSYDFSASSGTASANVNGTLVASYDDYVSLPGSTAITVDFTTTSGGFSTDIGAEANLEGYVDHIPFGSRWDFCFYCRDWNLDTGSSARPDFGVTRSGSDVISVAGVGPSFGSVASAQVSLNATQTSTFRLDEFTGLLRYTNQDTGTTGLTTLGLTGSSVLNVDLSEAGIWDFSFLDLDLDNRFASTMGASLSFNIDVIAVIDESWSFASLDLLDTGGFALDFGEKNVMTAFSITVPESGSSLLLAGGLLGLSLAGRRRR